MSKLVPAQPTVEKPANVTEDGVKTTEPEKMVDYPVLKPYVGNVSRCTLQRWKVPCIHATKRHTLYRISEVLRYIEEGGAQRAMAERRGKTA